MPEPKKRIGSRGCPACGSHNTEGVKSANTYWCITCRHRWTPCSAHCRGYRVELKPAPAVKGCPDCGVPDRVARYWPEAYRALARELDVIKQAALAE